MQNRIEDITKRLFALSEELNALRAAKLSAITTAATEIYKFRIEQLLRKRQRLVEDLQRLLTMKVYWVSDGNFKRLVGGLMEMEIRTIYSLIPGVDMSKLKIIEVKAEDFTF